MLRAWRRFPFPVTVVRKEGFTGPVRLVGVEPDRRGTLVPLAGQIAAGSDVGSIPLVLQHKVTEGTTHRCRVMGVAEVPGDDGKMYAVFHVAAGNMSIGCQPSLLTMTAEPAIVVWRPGETQHVEVQLMRRTAMQPITLRLAPPDGVVGIECEPVEISVDQDRAVLALRFAPDGRAAAAGDDRNQGRIVARRASHLRHDEFSLGITVRPPWCDTAILRHTRSS